MKLSQRSMTRWIGIPAAATLLLTLGFAAGVHAQAGNPFVKVIQVHKQEIPELPGKEIQIIGLDFAPNAVSPPHRHPGHVFVYVTEGSVKNEINDEGEKTFTAGQFFYEAPNDLHKSSSNASSTEPAKAVAFMILDKGKPQTSLEPKH